VTVTWLRVKNCAGNNNETLAQDALLISHALWGYGAGFLQRIRLRPCVSGGGSVPPDRKTDAAARGPRPEKSLTQSLKK